MMNIHAELDFEEKIDTLSDEGYLEEDNPIWDMYHKYQDLSEE